MIDLVDRLEYMARVGKTLAVRSLSSAAAIEIAHLRRELARAVRDIERLGTHTATITGCPICNAVRTYGLDPEALREEVGGVE